MPDVLWFRRDLRLADNPSAVAAAASATETGGVVALFVLDDVLLASTGAPRLAYLLDSLRVLDAALGGRLTVVQGQPAHAVPELARQVGAGAVHIASDFAPYGRRRDAAVEEALTRIGARLVRTGSPYAVAPGALQTGSGSPYRVFSPFHRAWLRHGWRSPAPAPAPVAWLPPARGQGIDALPPRPDLPGIDLPPAGEDQARLRWATFRDGALADYDEARDRLHPPGTSRLSAALRFGELHPRTLLADLTRAHLDRHRSGGAEAFTRQLAWREFFADVVFHDPSSTTRSMKPVVPEDAWADGDVERERLGAWTAGRTGYPFVDAGMRQLLAEAWLPNRVRMVVASFLVKDLHVRWQRGAEHFMRHLVDADIASNQQNWQWVAGTGTDAAPFHRIFNPVNQGRRYDAHGDYVRRHVPELRSITGSAVHEPWLLPGGIPRGYPPRVVDHQVERQQALADYRRAGSEASVPGGRGGE